MYIVPTTYPWLQAWLAQCVAPLSAWPSGTCLQPSALQSSPLSAPSVAASAPSQFAPAVKCFACPSSLTLQHVHNKALLHNTTSALVLHRFLTASSLAFSASSIFLSFSSSSLLSRSSSSLISLCCSNIIAACKHTNHQCHQVHKHQHSVGSCTPLRQPFAIKIDGQIH